MNLLKPRDKFRVVFCYIIKYGKTLFASLKNNLLNILRIKILHNWSKHLKNILAKRNLT